MAGHAPSLNAGAICAISSVFIIYVSIKSPLKYQWASENRISPKADIAWRQASQKWLDENK